jgi:hypothetical protein
LRYCSSLWGTVNCDSRQVLQAMKHAFFILLFITSAPTPSFSQDNESQWFDFWVGNWDVTWTEADGKLGRGTNTILMTLDNKVLQENFKIDLGTSKGYLGTSLSVYNPKKKTWHQGYADNQGAYFNFTGERQGDKRIFKTEPVSNGDKQIIQRMVFYDIKANSLTWDWESSEDGGKTWKLNWRINYKRAGS